MIENAKLLVATDFSPCGEQAGLVAVEWARRFGAELHWVHGAESMPTGTRPSSEPLLATYVDRARKHARERLREKGDRARELGLGSEESIIEGTPAEVVIQRASEVEADCVIVGSHGHTGLRRVWLGSVAERIVRDAPCSVLVVRGEVSPLEAGTIVVGDDLSPHSLRARSIAFDMAARTGARVEVVHSLELGIPYLSSVEVAVPNRLFSEAYESAAKRLAESATEAGHIDVENFVVSERAAAALCDRAEAGGAGLVAVGAHARHGGTRGLLGSVAQSVVRRSPCSVLVSRS